MQEQHIEDMVRSEGADRNRQVSTYVHLSRPWWIRSSQKKLQGWCISERTASTARSESFKKNRFDQYSS